MTLPALITVNGIIGDSSGPQAGRIVWHRNLPLYPAAGGDLSFQIPEEIVTVVGADGILNQPIYATNDPVCSPVGWTWIVTTHFPHWKQTFAVVVPYDAAGGEINLNKLAPVPPNEDGQLYALASHTHAGGGGGGTDITASQISDSTAIGRTLITTATAATARTALGLGGAAVLAVGTGSGNVAAGNAGILALAAATAADVTTLASATAAATTLANAALAAATAADVTTLASATAAATALATAALASATAADAAHVAAGDPHTNYTSIYYWNGSSYSIVTGANVYVGGTGPASPTNGDVWFSS